MRSAQTLLCQTARSPHTSTFLCFFLCTSMREKKDFSIVLYYTCLYAHTKRFSFCIFSEYWFFDVLRFFLFFISLQTSACSLVVSRYVIHVVIVYNKCFFFRHYTTLFNLKFLSYIFTTRKVGWQRRWRNTKTSAAIKI